MAPAPRMQDALYHDVLSPEETLAVRSEVRAFAAEYVAPVAERLANADEAVALFPRETFSAMTEHGLFEIPFPADVGGRGLRYPASATVATLEELAYWSNSVAAIYDVHCILAGHALERDRGASRAELLGPIVRGEIVAAFATSEPATSSDLSPGALETEATPVEGGWVVSGRKRWISNAPVADLVVCLCREGARLTALAIDLGAPGVRVGEPDHKMGNRGQLTADIVFDGVFVPATRVVGGQGEGLRVALQALTYGRIGIGAAGVGMAQRCFDESVARLKERRVFGRLLGESQHWQFKMAERATELENARSLYLKAALRLDAGVRSPEPEAAMAKHYGSALAVELSRDAVQIFGGYGYVHHLGDDGAFLSIESLYRDAKVGEIYEGANEIQKWIIAREIFGRDLTG